MVHGDEQTERLPFLSQSTQQTWAQVVDVAPGRGKLNMTAQLQEITTWRHRLYLIRCTLRLQAQHYHLRIAGLLPARNKMLGFCRVIDPSCYRMANIPKLLQQAIALLRDDTIVCPLASGREDAYLSLSGVLFVGSTADQRYVLHEHLQNLDLAGPTAPILHWSGHLQKGSHNTHVLPFRALAVLSAELLAIPVSTIGWAFEEVPVLSLREWEEYRRRTTSTVLILTTESKWSCSYRLLMERTRKMLPIMGSLWQLVLCLISYLCKWQSNFVQPPYPGPRQSGIPSLSDRAKWDAPAQCKELRSSNGHPSAQSSSTELRVSHSTLREALHMWWSALQGASETLPECSTAALTQVYRPTVLVRGCLPKGFHAPYLSH